jgi:hypothetical protein
MKTRFAKMVPSGILLAIIGGVTWSAVYVLQQIATEFALPS